MIGGQHVGGAGRNKGGGRRGGGKHGNGGHGRGGGGGGGRQQGPYPMPEKRGEAIKQAWQETRPEYLPIKRQLHQQISASDRRQHEVGEWWGDYLKAVQGAQDATQQGYANAAQQTQGLISQASALDNQNTARLNQEAESSAAVRGIAAPVASFTGRANAAQAQRNYLADVQGAATAARGANQFAYLADQQRIGAGQRVKSMMDEGARRRGYEDDLLAAKKEQGAQAIKNFGAARDRYREELLKKKAFGFEQKQAGQEAREKAGERAEDRHENRRKAHLEAEENRRANESQANENREQQNQNRKSRNEGKHGGRSPSERHDRQQSWNNAKAAAKTLYEAKQWKSWAELTKAVQKESEVSPAMARKAVERIRKHAEKLERRQQAANAVPHPFP